MSSIDDTFRILSREPFEAVRQKIRELNQKRIFTGKSAKGVYIQTLADAGWTSAEYYAALVNSVSRDLNKKGQNV